MTSKSSHVRSVLLPRAVAARRTHRSAACLRAR